MALILEGNTIQSIDDSNEFLLNCLSRLTSMRDPLPSYGLVPDGTFQTINTNSHAILRKVISALRTQIAKVPESDLPQFICSIGKCRVGSTVLTNIMGAAGLPAFYQPVKSILRNLLVEESVPVWNIPSRDAHSVIYSKEMLGPYTLIESIYNPLELLLEAGYPANKLHVLLLDRHPQVSLASWIRNWSGRISEDQIVKHYVLSSYNISRIRDYAENNGVTVTHFIYEFTKYPERAFRPLFKRLGILKRLRPEVLYAWDKCTGSDKQLSGIIFSKEPTAYGAKHIHSNDTSFKYREPGPDTDSDLYREIVSSWDLLTPYRENVMYALDDLSVRSRMVPVYQRLLPEKGKV